MLRAIELAKQTPAAPFGCVIVDRNSDSVIAEGYNQGEQNPLLHGEMVAINQCAQQHSNINWQQLILYTTAEPCAMCQSAIEWAGFSSVYYGTSIPFLQQKGWQQINIRAEQIAAATPFRNTQIHGGLLQDACNQLFEQINNSPYID